MQLDVPDDNIPNLSEIAEVWTPKINESEDSAMSHRQTDEVDIVEELRMRTWARENYVSADQRDQSWHPIILNEMSRRDEEACLPIEQPEVNQHSANQQTANPSEVLSRLRQKPADVGVSEPRVLNA